MDVYKIPFINGTSEEGYRTFYCNNSFFTKNISIFETVNDFPIKSALYKFCILRIMSKESYNTSEPEEKLEGESGLSIEEDKFLDIYPNAEVRIIPAQYSVSHLYVLCEKRHELILNPEYQRNKVWEKTQKCELVESILMGIPIPIIYLFESKDGKKQVIDGRQRISAILDFMNNKFKLKQLKILKGLNDLYFKDLEPKLQGLFEDFQMLFYIIQPPTPERVKYDIFDRVNRGGTKLNSQEMRNALYRGASTRLINEIADSKEFKDVTDKGVSPQRMRDKYVVLRSIAFYLYYLGELKDPYTNNLIEYKSDIDDFLAKTMIYLNENLTDEKIEKMVQAFGSAYKRIYRMFGSDAFRFAPQIPNNKRRPVNMPLMEILTLIFLLHKEEGAQFYNATEIKRFKRELDDSQLCNTNVDSSKNWTARINMINNFIHKL